MEVEKRLMLNDRAASELIGLAAQTLRNYRFMGKGPRYFKIGRAVRYREEDLLEWLERRAIDPESV